eukprot:scaffold271949_cov31-Prasinocladus_malaysianus.AAC.1
MPLFSDNAGLATNNGNPWHRCVSFSSRVPQPCPSAARQIIHTEEDAKVMHVVMENGLPAMEALLPYYIQFHPRVCPNIAAKLQKSSCHSVQTFNSVFTIL